MNSARKIQCGVGSIVFVGAKGVDLALSQQVIVRFRQYNYPALS